MRCNTSPVTLARRWLLCGLIGSLPVLLIRKATAQEPLATNVGGNHLAEQPHDTSAAADTSPVSTTAASKPVAGVQSSIPGVDEAYVIGTEDELQVSVWHEPELSVQVVVRPDGMITMPLIDDLKVAGMTTKQLQKLITDKLKAYVTEPQVTIIVRGIRSRRVYLLGNVGHTGAFELNGRRTVMQTLAEAGGLGAFAKAQSIYVIRQSGGHTQKIPFNYKRALKGDERDDFLLLPGDMVVVP